MLAMPVKTQRHQATAMCKLHAVYYIPYIIHCIITKLLSYFKLWTKNSPRALGNVRKDQIPSDTKTNHIVIMMTHDDQLGSLLRRECSEREEVGFHWEMWSRKVESLHCTGGDRGQRIHFAQSGRTTSIGNRWACVTITIWKWDLAVSAQKSKSWHSLRIVHWQKGQKKLVQKKFYIFKFHFHIPSSNEFQLRSEYTFAPLLTFSSPSHHHLTPFD